jgi:virginiamycin B lyase
MAIALLAAGCAQHALVSAPNGSPSLVQPSRGARSELKTKNVLVHYPLNTQWEPTAMTLGSDQSVWFNSLKYTFVGSITQSGSITTYTLGAGQFASDMAAGSINTIWFTEFGSGYIGEITNINQTQYALPPNSFTEGISSGPAGTMWFTDSGNNSIGRISPAGKVTEFPVPTANAHPFDIVTGPDGNLWFTEAAIGSIGRITTSGSVTEFAGPGDNPSAIAVGADGNLYAASGRGIWRITTAGVINEFQSPTDGAWRDIILGPDKQLWMTSHLDGTLVEFNPKTATFSQAIQPDSGGAVDGLVVGGDGDVWIAGYSGNDILVYEEKLSLVGVRLNGEMSFTDPNYGFELGYALGTGKQSQTVMLSAGESVQFQNLDTIPHSAAFLGDAPPKSAPWPSSFDGSTTPSPAGTAIGTTGFSTGSLNGGKKSPIYETGLPGFYMFGCQYHYNTDMMRTVIVVH